MRDLGASLVLAISFSLALPAAAQAIYVEGDGARDEFLYAWNHIADLGLSVSDSPKLRRYPLFRYLEAERLRVELARVPGGQRDHGRETRVIALLTAHPDEPPVRGLHRDFLGYLGARSEWTEFSAWRSRWPGADLPDESLRCHEFSARLATNNLEGLRDKVLSQWMESRSAPAACAVAYAWIDSADRLSASEIERRARYTGRERLSPPASLNSLLPARQEALTYWRDADRDAEKVIGDFLAHRRVPVAAGEQREAVLRAFERLARADSDRGRILYKSLAADSRMEGADRYQLHRSYALGMAYDRDPEALRQFSGFKVAADDTLVHEWRLRTALWHDDWRLVATGLAELPTAMSAEPRWQYWHGRLEERRGAMEQARAWFAMAAKEREYYGFLAAERLGDKADLRHKPLAEDWPTLDLLAATPALRRARELLACDLPDQANAEFNFALRALPDSAKPQMIRLAANWGWHDRAVRLQAELGLWNDLWLRFPLPYNGEIEAATRDTQVPANWLYSVIRTESLYNPRAVSGVGAQGLLQLMPATAREVAKRWGLSPPSVEELLHPEVNIALGARYLHEMTEKFDGAFILTLAAYNAGPQRIPRWLPKRAVDGDIWVENIPFNETRTYVQRALSSLVMIGWRRNGEPAPILPLLEPVSARP